jgi:hypothetical protein
LESPSTGINDPKKSKRKITSNLNIMLTQKRLSVGTWFEYYRTQAMSRTHHLFHYVHEVGTESKWNKAARRGLENVCRRYVKTYGFLSYDVIEMFTPLPATLHRAHYVGEHYHSLYAHDGGDDDMKHYLKKTSKAAKKMEAITFVKAELPRSQETGRRSVTRSQTMTWTQEEGATGSKECESDDWSDKTICRTRRRW